MEKIELNPSEEKLIKQLQIGKESEEVENELSGQKVMLEPKAVALFDFIKGAEYMVWMSASGGSHSTQEIKQFNVAKELFRKLYPEEYMVLLD